MDREHEKNCKKEYKKRPKHNSTMTECLDTESYKYTKIKYITKNGFKIKG